MGVDLLSRVERSCARGAWMESLRLAVLGDLGEAVGFDGHVWLLTDPTTAVGTSPLATLPGVPMPRLPDLIRARYLTTSTRWTSLRGHRVPATSWSRAGHRETAASYPWRDVLAEFGVCDVATVVFVDRFGCWGWLDLWRFGVMPFPADDLDRMSQIAPPVTAALRSRQAGHFTEPVRPADSTGPAVVVLDEHLRLRGQTAGAGSRLFRLNPPDAGPDGRIPDVPAIPAAAYNVAAQLVARERGVDAASPRARVFLEHYGWLTLEADRMSGERPPTGRDIAVTIERSGFTDRLDLFARVTGLTSREREVLGRVCAGMDNRSIAAAVSVSEHTVHVHVKSTLRKTECGNRTNLIARIAG
ncbi:MULTISPECIES: helix-turn-helix transcriptional regulator [Gordonia]|uniref:helix-turn-helix transcriptional regulator n=1 Tax=Gordonia TaxID=2053 RepID=UPI0004B28F9A|nr:MULTISPECIES: helix-turn-helix transcriptional regulator [Gordonia]MDH3006623.1 helix-turn-helix transcriptional regulator [Gordonia alkanivorans]MDH3009937.1 helix-turn-helix transcriptional regulator [Gordonia alkanivorans]MDH3014381.1 helix-turn-helix transcriptional regulator [Gordonia alkanivorans]MDH3018515.1 helix-turn-helix transcriptional regulator [Gordonia alkanivorans]MDH3041831.1 helix-turn-helix transcriptional regulator [Gordonia alkanivorans]